MRLVLGLYVVVLYLLNFILGVTDGLSLPEFPSHTCVIGAGYSGLAAARYLQKYGVNFTVYEASREVGGTWRFDPHVGTDEDGLPLFTSQYKYLRTNTPRQIMEFNGFTLPEDAPSYPSGICFYKYLKSFVKEFDLMKNIQVRSYVTSVKWNDEHWELTYTNTENRNNYTVLCDFMIIANGQYVNPKVPDYPGLDTFEGTVLHSHDYKDPEDYKGRTVLLVGAGPSGLDLSTQLVNLTTKLVHSHHLKYIQPEYPENYIKKPDIKAFISNGVIFEDESFEEVDTVIFCTGYDYGQPFLDESAGLMSTGKFLLPLYQHIVNIKHPSMTFIGVVRNFLTRLLDTQAHYAAALAAGEFKLPSQEEMLDIWFARVFNLQRKNLKITDVNRVDDTDQYLRDLTSEAGFTQIPPVLTEIRDFNAMNRLENILNYRDYDYQILDDYTFKRWYNPKKEVCNIEV